MILESVLPLPALSAFGTGFFMANWLLDGVPVSVGQARRDRAGLRPFAGAVKPADFSKRTAERETGDRGGRDQGRWQSPKERSGTVAEPTARTVVFRLLESHFLAT